MLDSGTIASVIHKDVLHKCHKIIEQKHVWFTMVGTLNQTSTMEMELKLPELNHNVAIYTNYALLNCNLILGRDKLYDVGIIFNFKNKNIAWQEVSISMKVPNCIANKFFVINESCPVRYVTKRIKLI